MIVELIHIATLVHDDVMDEAEQRRAQPTANARWGNSLSVLLGDCLFAHALTLSTNFENSDIGRAIARTATTVCSGEMIQTQRRFDLNLTVEDYLRIVQMKTGSLFSAAAELAAVISEADPKMIATFKNFGFQIGTAYQIYDDCVDLAGTESVTGKTLGTDLRKGKFTLPVLIFLRSASEFERERCCQLVLDENIEEMIELLKNGANNGALNESIAAGSDLIRKAQYAFDGIAPNRYTDALFSLGDVVVRHVRSTSRLMNSGRDLGVPTFSRIPSQREAAPTLICRSLKSAKCRRTSGRGKSCLHEGRTLSATPN